MGTSTEHLRDPVAGRPQEQVAGLSMDVNQTKYLNLNFKPIEVNLPS